MDNLEILTKIEEWVDNNEYDMQEDLGHTILDVVGIPSSELIRFLRKLLT